MRLTNTSLAVMYRPVPENNERTGKRLSSKGAVAVLCSALYRRLALILKKNGEEALNVVHVT